MRIKFRVLDIDIIIIHELCLFTILNVTCIYVENTYMTIDNYSISMQTKRYMFLFDI